jgi:hypothetical protein
MSTGVSYFEQCVWDLKQRGASDIDVPALVIGIGYTRVTPLFPSTGIETGGALDPNLPANALTRRRKPPSLRMPAQ